MIDVLNLAEWLLKNYRTIVLKKEQGKLKNTSPPQIQTAQ